MLKIVILLITLMFCWSNLYAQKESNINLKMEAGLNWKPAEKDINLWGQLYSLELKLKTSKNTSIGLRIQANENYQTNEKYKPPQFFMDNNIRINLYQATSSTIVSFVPTFDYYFIKNSLRPYLGIGIGYYMMALPAKNTERSIPSGILETSVNNQVGFLIRGGLDLGNLVGMKVGKLTIGLEFNYLPKGDIKIPNGLIVGTVDDSFISLSMGYSFGIGKR